jgi:hypothetical protein
MTNPLPDPGPVTADADAMRYSAATNRYEGRSGAHLVSVELQTYEALVQPMLIAASTGRSTGAVLFLLTAQSADTWIERARAHPEEDIRITPRSRQRFVVPVVRPFCP